MKVSIYILFIVAILSGCNSAETKRRVDNGEGLSGRKSDSIIFLEIYRDTPPMHDTIMADAIHDMFRNNSASLEEYAIYFSYLLKNIHEEEALSEGIGNESYIYFKANEDVRKDIRRYIDFLPPAKRDSILDGITSIMAIDLMYNHYTIEQYKKDFTYLAEKPNIEAFEKLKKDFVE